MSRRNHPMPILVTTLTLLGQLVCSYAIADSATVSDDEPKAFLEANDIAWKVNDFNVARWKTLIGGIEGGQIDAADIQFGLWQLAPGSTYHGHKHVVPEIYYILSGTAEWTVGTKTQQVSAGTTIYTRPGKVHKMVNLTDKPVETIWVWWAPGGDRKVFAGDYQFTEPRPEQPEGAGFKSGAEEKLY